MRYRGLRFTRRSKTLSILTLVTVALSGLATAHADPVTQCQSGQSQCMPTAQECATGTRTGFYWYGAVDRPLTACAGAAGHNFVYVPGHPFFRGGCGGAMVADAEIGGDPDRDPNTCPGAVLEHDGTAASVGPFFDHYPVPKEMFDPDAGQEYAGETSIGVDPRTNAIMFLNNLLTYRVGFDDAGIPAVAHWKDVSYLVTDVATGDPFLWTDPVTARTFVAQCVPRQVGDDPGAGTSLIAYTDDDGETWQISEPPVTGMPYACAPKVGTGPYASPAPPRASSYPNAVYYCEDAFDVDVVPANIAQCARSDDGGRTWGVPVVADAFACEAPQFGTQVVGSKGTVLVPFSGCFNQSAVPGLLTSEDNGLSWNVRSVPSATQPRFRPQLAFDAGKRLYLIAELDGRPVVTTSDDEAKTWSVLTNVGGPFGLQNIAFPAVVAGDPGRAAVAFYGTTTPGSFESPSFAGVWHLYVSTTIDGGNTWETVDATPDDPVQRGCIDMGGGDGSCRNLLDFQSMAVDRDGRIVVGYADGCVSVTCVGAGGTPNDSRASLGTIARQVGGERLLTGSPGPEPPAPPAAPPPTLEPGCTPGTNHCFPTSAQCATGNYNGYWPGGKTGRAGICVGGGGHVVFYVGGNAKTPCGVVIVADLPVEGDPRDPNHCP